ncbi:uncharacterized protein ACNS7B_012492 [Menidia menidia]
MMKYVFALVLLQLCYVSNSDMNLNNEIFQSLEGLRNLTHLIKIKIDRPIRQIVVPDNSEDLSHCVRFFSENLRNLLGHVPEKEDWNSLLQTLNANLIKLEQDQKRDDRNCTTKPGKTFKKAFVSYITYFRKLNNKK